MRNLQTTRCLPGIVVLGLLLAAPAQAQLTTYVYQGPFYDDFRSNTDPPAGEYTADMRVTGCFTTGEPLLDNSGLQDVFGLGYGDPETGLVRSYAFNDGLRTLAYRAAPGGGVPGTPYSSNHFNDLVPPSPPYSYPGWGYPHSGRIFEVYVRDGAITQWDIAITTPDTENWGDLHYEIKTHYYYRSFDWHKLDDGFVKYCRTFAVGCTGPWGLDWARVSGPDEPSWDGFWTRIDGANDADGDGICDITLAPPDSPPTADAGDDQSIRAGQTVSLDGSGSSDDNGTYDTLGYAWTLTVPPGSEAALDVDGGQPWLASFVADVAETYEVGLVVTDSAGQESEAAVVTISADNLAPTADAGENRLVFVNAEVALDGRGSFDPEGDTLDYAWTLTLPEGSLAVLDGADTVEPWFTTDSAGDYTALLVVSDALGPGEPDDVTITAVTASDYAAALVVGTAEMIEALPLEAVKAPGNQVALTELLGQAVKAGRKGDVSHQIKKILDAMSRTDGCVLNGAPDARGSGMDWVTDCDAQRDAYYALQAALDALTTP